MEAGQEFARRLNVAKALHRCVRHGRGHSGGAPVEAGALLAETIAAYKSALAAPGVQFRPFTVAEILQTLSTFYLLAGRLDSAVHAIDLSGRLVAAEPTDPHGPMEAIRWEHQLRLASLGFAQGQTEESTSLVGPAFARVAELGGNLSGCGSLLLLSGDWAGGLRDRRDAYQDLATWAPPAYSWLQEPEELDVALGKGHHVVILGLGGLGDQLQQVQCHPALVQRGAAVTWILRPEIATLAARELAEGQVRAFSPDHAEWPAPSAGVVGVRGAALPYLLRVGPAFPLGRGVFSRPARPSRGGDTLTIGFSWKGAKYNTGDLNRSSPLNEWRPLFALPAVRWVCLQPDRTPEEDELLRRTPSVVVPPRPRDLTVTADHARACDLVLSVNSSLAHLGGVLGLKTWLLLNPLELDGQWGAQGSQSVWYESVWIWRHRTPGDWAEVLGRIAQALSLGVAGLGDPHTWPAEVGC